MSNVDHSKEKKRSSKLNPKNEKNWLVSNYFQIIKLRSMSTGINVTAQAKTEDI